MSFSHLDAFISAGHQISMKVCHDWYQDGWHPIVKLEHQQARCLLLLITSICVFSGIICIIQSDQHIGKVISCHKQSLRLFQFSIFQLSSPLNVSTTHSDTAMEATSWSGEWQQQFPLKSISSKKSSLRPACHSMLYPSSPLLIPTKETRNPPFANSNRHTSSPPSRPPTFNPSATQGDTVMADIIVYPTAMATARRDSS